MLLSRLTIRLNASLLSCFLLLCWANNSNAQQPSTNVSAVTAQGINLYRQGDYKEAINVLRIEIKQREDDADAWYYLGLSLFSNQDRKNARQAFEQAIRWRPDFVIAHLDFAFVLLDLNELADAANEARRIIALNPKMIESHYILGVVHLLNNESDKALVEANAALKLKPDCNLGLLLRTLALINKFIEEQEASHNSSASCHSLFSEALENLEKYVKTLNSGDPIVMRDQLESLPLYAQLADENKPFSERTVFRSSEVTTKAQITDKPVPELTDAARRMEISGTVKLSAIFGADGKVKGILLLRPLQEGLTETAIAAARKIKFVPATKDGRTVSQIAIFEMNFSNTKKSF